MSANDRALHILALHPSSKGFGWALFDAPASLVDWGLASVPKDRNSVALNRLERLLAQFPVQCIVLESFEGRGSKRSKRIRALNHAIVTLAGLRGIPIRVIQRDQVFRCFPTAPSQTREGTASAVSRHLPELAHRLPPHRKPWMSEDPRMALFAAAALGIAHFALGEDRAA